MDFLGLLAGLVLTSGGAVVVIRYLKGSQWRVVQILQLEVQMYSLGYGLEKDVASLYGEFIEATDGWESSNRLNEAMLDAKRRYQTERDELVEEAAQQLRELQSQAKELLSSREIQKLIDRIACQFPAIGLISGK
jgi:hypothetical protein